MKGRNWFGPSGLAIIMMVLTQGCTELKVHKVNNTTQLPDQPGTISYILPKKTFQISATYELKDCRTIVDNKTSQPALNLDLSTTINIIPITEADPDEQYYIDYNELWSFWKETNITVETYNNKTLKSFNGVINDQTGPIVTAAIATAIKIAALAAAAAPSVEYCNDSAISALTKIEALRTKLKNAGKKNGPSEAEIAKIHNDINKLINDHLTSKVFLTWSPQLGDLVSTMADHKSATIELKPDQAIQKWLSSEGRQWLSDNPDPSRSIFAMLDVPTWFHHSNQDPVLEVNDGLVLRDPAPGVINVCKGKCPIQTNGLTSVDNVLYTANIVVPQFGRKLLLPLHNPIFSNDELEVSMSEEGVITKLSVHSTSTAEKSVSALGANADAAKNTLDAQAKARSDALTKAQNNVKDQNKILADCLDAQKTIVKNGGVPIGSCQ